MGKSLTAAQKQRISDTLKARGIQPSPEARLKALEVNRAKVRTPPGPCTNQGCQGLIDSKGLCKPCYDKNRTADPVISSERKRKEKQKAERDPDYHKRNNVKRYGITLEQYYDAVASVYGQCEICENVPRGEGRHGCLHIDHCHVTERVRGLLCHHCNTGIGGFHHSIELLESAKQYLIKHGAAEDAAEEAF